MKRSSPNGQQWVEMSTSEKLGEPTAGLGMEEVGSNCDGQASHLEHISIFR